MDRWPNPDGPWQITLDWKVIDGRIECVGVHLVSDTPVTTTVWRDVKIGEHIRRQRAAITQQASAATGRQGGMRRSSRARMEEAARVYREAFARGVPPAKAVADALGLTPGGASSLVSRARAAGLLPPTSPGAPQA